MQASGPYIYGYSALPPRGLRVQSVMAESAAAI